ncbi:unnamed protein product [Paramecium sonneborni]|uniref:Transmembrane protein n=1 Tax=Paramecium sonneborni TaxID=65129 RepID=A0A8S1M0B6_9CILI|nr:unnamed protein product [Paramecium sonneborni]
MLSLRWLSTNSSEQFEGALEIISSFVSFTEGFNFIILKFRSYILIIFISINISNIKLNQTKKTKLTYQKYQPLVLFFQYLYPTKELIKIKALHYYVSFFVTDQTTPQPPKKFFGYIHYQEMFLKYQVNFIQMIKLAKLQYFLINNQTQLLVKFKKLCQNQQYFISFFQSIRMG